MREQRVELVELRLQGVIARKSGGALDLADGWVKGAIGVLRRAEIAQTGVRLGRDGFEQRCSQSRLANTGLADEQHHLAFASFCLRPAPQQQFKFFLPSDEISQPTAMQCLKTACRRAWSQCRPGAHRAYNSLQILRPQILEIKQIAEKLSCALGNNRGVRLGDSLKLRGEVRGFANDAALLRTSPIGHIADDHEASGNPDSRLQRRARFQRGHRRDQFKCRSNRMLRVVLMRLRIAKINYGSVAVRVGHESVVPTKPFQRHSHDSFG